MAKKNAKVYAFLDTNVYLEFRDFDQIDWPTVLGYKRVCLVLAPIILTELEHFKYDQKSERRLSRSRSITKKLDQIIFSTGANKEAAVPGRSGVTLLALTDSPNVSSYAGLDSDIADDHLIASILQFTANNPTIEHQHILLIGDDAGCLNKARARNIVVRRLDDQFRLPDEPSATHKELASLKRQLQDLQTKRPNLSLAILTDDGASQEISTTIMLLREPDAAVVERLYSGEEAATHWEPPKPPKSQNAADRSTTVRLQNVMAAALLASGNTFSQDEIDRYQDARKQYLNSFKEYLRRLYTWEQRRGRSRKIVLTLINDGTVPAVGVVVRLVIPDGISVYEEEDFPRPPRTPRRPTLPRTDMQKTMDSIRFSTPFVAGLSSYSTGAVPPIDPDTAGPKITRYNSMLVEWERSKVVHHIPLDLTPLVLEFNIKQEHCDYELSYRIIADNVPTPITGNICLSVALQEQTFDIVRALERNSPPDEEDEDYEE